MCREVRLDPAKLSGGQDRGGRRPSVGECRGPRREPSAGCGVHRFERLVKRSDLALPVGLEFLPALARLSRPLSHFGFVVRGKLRFLCLLIALDGCQLSITLGGNEEEFLVEHLFVFCRGARGSAFEACLRGGGKIVFDAVGAVPLLRNFRADLFVCLIDGQRVGLVSRMDGGFAIGAQLPRMDDPFGMRFQEFPVFLRQRVRAEQEKRKYRHDSYRDRPSQRETQEADANAGREQIKEADQEGLPELAERAKLLVDCIQVRLQLGQQCRCVGESGGKLGNDGSAEYFAQPPGEEGILGQFFEFGEVSAH